MNEMFLLVLFIVSVAATCQTEGSSRDLCLGLCGCVACISGLEDEDWAGVQAGNGTFESCETKECPLGTPFLTDHGREKQCSVGGIFIVFAIFFIPGFIGYLCAIRRYIKDRKHRVKPFERVPLVDMSTH